MRRSPGVAVLAYGVLVMLFGVGTVACDQGLGTGQEPECYRAGIADGHFGQQADHPVGGGGVARALGGLDEIGQRELELRGVVLRLTSIGPRGVTMS
jgi:hypothetical protein